MNIISSGLKIIKASVTNVMDPFKRLTDIYRFIMLKKAISQIGYKRKKINANLDARSLR
jgi:uncharacterized protein YfkK (UPF0435 family)